MNRRSLVTVVLVLAVIGLAARATNASAATPDTSVSSNWAGYVVDGRSFSKVSGSWIEPTATCDSETPTFSSFWVGIGGASDSSAALEQIGSAADCGADGTASYYLWYELVPAPPRRVRLTVNPGDVLVASVKVVRKQVTLQIADTTRRTKSTRVVKMHSPDRSSAEWIAEAPSECDTSGFCSVLPLTNFGTVAFTNATATASRHTGTISDDAWSATQVALQSNGTPRQRFVTELPSGSANPSDLSPDGSAFTVAWQAPSTSP